MSRSAPISLRSHRIPRITLVASAGVLSAGLVLSGCSSSGGSATSAASGSGSAAAPAAAVKTGGNLRIAIDSDPICVDPSQSSLIASGVIGRQLVDSLVEQDPTTGTFKPWLATSWTSNADATQYAFILRTGVTFSDGSVLDSAAVKKFFDQIVANPGKEATGAAFLSGYASTTVTDPTHFTVNFKTPNAAFLAGAGSRSLGILSPASVDTPLADRCLGKGVIGSGPFIIDSYVPSQTVKLSARKDYNWGPPLAKHTGRAYLDTVTYSVNPESSVRSGALKSGQVDVATTIQPQDEDSFKGNGFQLLSRINPGVVTSISPDLQHSTILKDVQVRKAIQLSINRDDIAQDVLTPTYGVAKSILGQTTPGFADFSSALASDPAQAEKILDADGWKVGSGGIREKNGQKLSLSVLYFYQPNVYEYLQQELRKVGIDLKLDQVTAAEYTTDYTTGKYDFLSSSFSRPDPDILRTVFGPELGNTAHLSLSDPAAKAFDAELTAQRTTTDRIKRDVITKQLQATLINEDWAFPLSQLTQVIGASKSVTGIRFDSFSIIELYDAGFSK
jgi:peptide/nickel transport system substrate-binding protein